MRLSAEEFEIVRKELAICSDESKTEQKEKLIEYMKEPVATEARNRMGCSENWYDPYYAISRTFTLTEIKHMSIVQIDDLIRLANNISEGLY